MIAPSEHMVLQEVKVSEGRKAETDLQVELASRLIARLERLSADSYWAHKASGIRGALLHAVEEGNAEDHELRLLVNAGFAILVRAAKDR